MFCKDDLASMISVALQRARKLRATRGSFTIKPCSGHTWRSRGHGLCPKALFVSDQVSEDAKDKRKVMTGVQTSLCRIMYSLSSNWSLVERLSLSIEKDLRCEMQECNDS